MRLAELSSRISDIVPRRGLNWELPTDPRAGLYTAERSAQVSAGLVDRGCWLIAQSVDKLFDFVALAVLLLCGFLR